MAELLVKTYIDENRRRIVRYACGCGLRITHLSERSASGDPQIAVERSECPLHAAAQEMKDALQIVSRYLENLGSEGMATMVAAVDSALSKAWGSTKEQSNG